MNGMENDIAWQGNDNIEDDITGQENVDVDGGRY